jgi:hypothetical protein
MVVKKIINFFYSLIHFTNDRKIDSREFKIRLRGKISIVSNDLDAAILNWINEKYFTLNNLSEIEILTRYSNCDKEFHKSWAGLDKYAGGFNVIVKVKILNRDIPPEVYIINNAEGYRIPIFSFHRENNAQVEIKELFIIEQSDEIINQICDAIAHAEDISHLKGQSYNKKIEKIFEIDKRNFSSAEAEKIIEAIYAWECSGNGYEEIGPLWRIYEDKIRKFIKFRLERNNPTTWFSRDFYGKLNKHKKQLIDNQFNTEKKELGITQLDHHPNPLQLANPGDYATVIENNSKLFPEFFQMIGKIDGNALLSDLKFIATTRSDGIHPKTTKPPVLGSNFIVKTLIVISFLNDIETAIR